MDLWSGNRTLLVKLPPGLPNERYAAIAHAIFSVLDAAGLAGRSSMITDDAATDDALNAAFDRHSEAYPWGA